MPTKITMPQLGESVNEGTIGQWLKQEGDTVKKDEALVEIITDKVTAELPSPASGVLVKILVQADETVKVGAEIAEIEEAGAATSSSATPTAQANSQPAPTSSAQTSGASMNGGTNGGVSNGGVASGPNGHRDRDAHRLGSNAAARAHGARLAAGAPPRAGASSRPQCDPWHRRGRAHPQGGHRGVSAAAITDGDRHVAACPGSRPDAASTAHSRHDRHTGSSAQRAACSTVAVSGEDQIITPTPARRAIAEHMVRSKHTSPHAWTAIEVDMTNVARWLDGYKDEFKRREGFGVSFQTSVIKAAAEALKDHPYLNASWTDDGKIALRKQVNIGVSIALENNLIVPVIRNADTLNLAGIARAVNDLVTRARANRLMPADLQGATFTVNNPGVFGTVLSAAIINQPNAAILTMDTVVKRAVVINDGIAIRSMMFLSLSFDHRVLDGLQAARFLAALKQRLETWSPDTSAY